MIIRYARPEDVKRIAVLWEQMVKELAPGYKPNVSWWTAMADKFMKTEIYCLIVAETMGKIVGFLDSFIYPEPSTGKLHGIGQHFYVIPGYRKTGVAGRLYRQALRHGRDKGVEALELFCFKGEEALWQKRGFTPVRTLMRR